MVKFEFTVTDTDAENIGNILQGAYIAALGDVIKSTAANDAVTASWFEHHAEYIKSLKEKVMSSTVQVKEASNG